MQLSDETDVISSLLAFHCPIGKTYIFVEYDNVLVVVWVKLRSHPIVWIAQLVVA
jgi:hypothetical protein